MSALDDLLRAQIEAAVKAAIAELRTQTVEHITIAEYARRWSISQSTVRQAIADKRLAAHRIGRAVRIPADAKIGRGSVDRAARADLRLLRGGSVK